ncbi:MAG: hypothetical protein JW741_04450 [Sedimentisphaerales bacterium]|nr:hypothetical protein [Sedimentisphaerales bacterium]
MEIASNASSEQELLQLRNEGKITETEYHELLAAMRRPPAPDEALSDASKSCSAPQIEMLGRRGIPPVLWIALVSLALMVLGKVLFAFKLGPGILIGAGLSAALLVGLYLGHKWAYVLTIVFTALGTITALTKGVGNGLAVLLGDCLVLVPVLLSRDYFFPKPDLRRN